jgi:uncharacterized cupin superfamily protein
MPKLAIPDWTEEGALEHPILGAGLGPFAYRSLGDAAGLTQFGFHLERLPPGSGSSFRHWHETEDEIVYMLEGEVMLVEDDGETPLRPGDAAGWKAGAANGHCLVNRGAADAVYLLAGTRSLRDTVHYPDHDLTVAKDGPRRRYMRADGTVIKET